MEVVNIAKAATRKSFFQLSYKNTQITFFVTVIFMRKALTDDFGRLHKKYELHISFNWSELFPKSNASSNKEILQFRLWALLKSGLDSSQVYPCESSSYMLYKALYVNSFCNFYQFCYHYLVNIALWSLYVIKRKYFLFACVFVFDSSFQFLL